MITASITSSRAIVGFTDQPMMRREYKSITTAKYNHVCQVRM